MPKVSVPKSVGDEVTITRRSEAKTWRITDGEATVAADDLDLFLGNVEGAREVAKPATSSQKEK